MLRRLTAIALILGLWGCGEEARIQELLTYVKAIQKFDKYNEDVERYIVQFDDPSREVTQNHLDSARSLLDQYAALVSRLEEDLGGLDDSMLRNTHGLYVRTFPESRDLARDETGIAEGNLRRQAQSVAIGFRHLRRVIEERVYPTIDVLLTREGKEGGEYALIWPEDK